MENNSQASVNNGGGITKKSSSTSVGTLIVALIALVGVYNSVVDRGLIDYHNKFVKEAFNSILLKKWNPLIERVEANKMQDPEMAEYLKNELIPEIKKWNKTASEMTPPEFAKEYHLTFISELTEAIKNAENAVKAVENGDDTVAFESSKQLSKTIEKIQTSYGTFKEKLVKERDFTFEKDK